VIDVRVERKYEIFFMEEEGNKRILLTRDVFPKRHHVGFSRNDISVLFDFNKNRLIGVTISSKASVVATKTLRMVELEDEEEVKNYLKIRCLKDLRGLMLFLVPIAKTKVKRLRRTDIVIKSKIWQWDFGAYCNRLVRNAMPELNPKDARGLIVFLRGSKHG